MRMRRGPSKRGDGLSTTPTQYGDTSPDYRPTAGDPDFLKSYSEEQIGMMGGRDRVIQLATESQRRAAERDQATTITTETPSPVEGPTTPPTTYGVGEMPSPGKSGEAPGQMKPKPGSPAAKKKLQKRIARTTGTTVGEAQGIMKGVRKQVRAGNKAGARRTLTRALSGGKTAGVKRTPKRSAKAAAAATKITKRIATRQAQSAPKRRKK